MATGLRMLLFVLLTIALLWTAESQTPITCTAGHYKPGEKATITCHFHGDVSTDQNTGVYITWFDLNSPKDSSGKEVLMCHFSGGAVSVCKPEDGYRFVIFKNNLTIEVPDVSAEFQGRYSCGVVPANGRIAHPCFLLVEGAFAQPEDAPPEKPETNEKLHKHVQTTHTLVIITFIIIIIIVAAAAIIFGTLAYKKNWFPFRKDAAKHKHDEENASMLGKVEPERAGTLTVSYRPVTQETTPDSSAALSSSVEQGKPLLAKEDTEQRDFQSGREDDKKEDDAVEKKVESKKEKKEREKKEKAEKEKEKKREKEETKAAEKEKKQAESDAKKRLKEEKEAEKKEKKTKKK